MSTGETHGSKAQYPSPPVWEGAATSVFPPEPFAEHRSLPTASPNLSPKGSITVLSDDELGLGDPKFRSAKGHLRTRDPSWRIRCGLPSGQMGVPEPETFGYGAGVGAVAGALNRPVGKHACGTSGSW